MDEPIQRHTHSMVQKSNEFSVANISCLFLHPFGSLLPIEIGSKLDITISMISRDPKTNYGLFQRSHMVNKQILDYVQKSLEGGYSVEQISTALTGEGWNPTEINEALLKAQEIIQQKSVAPLAPPNKSEG